MATPRKHWWRVSDEVAYEPWSNDVAATFLRLGAHLNTRWAREGRNAADACQVTLSRGTALQLTGSGSLARARSILRELATSITLVIDEQGTNTVVRWSKFAEFQKYESGPGVALETVDRSAVPPPPPPPPPPPQDAKKNQNGAAAPARDRLRSQVREIWPRCVEAARKHGRRWETLNDARLSHMAARAKEHGSDPEVLVKAIDGAVNYWRSCAPEGTDPARNLTPETLYRASNFAKYLEAASDPATTPRKLMSEMTREERLQWMRDNGQLPPEVN